MKKLLTILTLLATFTIVSFSASKLPYNIIIVGWDAAQREHLKESLSKNELPNLVKLSKEGTLTAINILRTTDTKAGWSEILTGYDYKLTGVINNRYFKPISAGYSIFERVEKEFGKDNVATVAVIGKDEHVGNDKGLPYFITSKNMDVFINKLGTNNNVGSKALELLDTYKNTSSVFFIHFAEIDNMGHKYGENSKQYNDALISCDQWLGKIVDKLKELKLYDKTLIYVTADHGFDEGLTSHSNAPYVFLGTNDNKVIRSGYREDITPTILDRIGIDINSILPQLTGHSLLRPFELPKW